MVDCSNLCSHSEDTCLHCKENYDVSKEFYIAKRLSVEEYVVGYLVKDKEGNVKGILNKTSDFYELAWIDESTIEMYAENL